MKSNQEKNAEQAAELYLQLFDHLFALAYRILGRTDLAEDAVANTFLKWMTCSPEFHAQINNPKSYLIRMVRTEALRMKKYQGRLVTLQDFNWDERHAVDLMGKLFKKASSSDLVQLLLTALEQRYPKSRYAQILRLFYISEYSHKEIAEALEITVANSKVTLRRAKLACCRLYKELFPDDDPSAGARARDNLGRPGKIDESDERDIDPCDREPLDPLSCEPPGIRDTKIRYLNNCHEFKFDDLPAMKLLLHEFENDPDQLLNYLQRQKIKLLQKMKKQALNTKSDSDFQKIEKQLGLAGRGGQEIAYAAPLKEQLELIDASLSSGGSGDDIEEGPTDTELGISEISRANLYSRAKEKIRKHWNHYRFELERPFTIISFGSIAIGKTISLELSAYSSRNAADLPDSYFRQACIPAPGPIGKVPDGLMESQTDWDLSRLFVYWDLNDKVLLSKSLRVEINKSISSSEAPTWSIDFDSYDSICESEQTIFLAEKKQARRMNASNNSDLDWEINYTSSQRVRFIPRSMKVQGISLPEDLTIAPPEISHKAKPIYYQLLDHFGSLTAIRVHH